MRLQVLLFASYADAFGAPCLEVELPDGDATVAALVDAVRARPAGGRLTARPLVAVNHEYARWDHPLRPGDEVALLPPVAGG